MNANSLASNTPTPPVFNQPRVSWAGTAAALFPLLIWPASILILPLIGGLIRAFSPSDPAALIQIGGVLAGWLFLLLIGIVVAALIVAWVRGWPEWSFPYLIAMLLVSLTLSYSATPGLKLFGYTFQSNDLWGWRAWIPEMIWLAISLAISRSLRPVGQLFKSIGQDWTRLSFGLYAFLPGVLLAVFDEMQGEDVFVALLGLLLSAGALVYLRSNRKGWRFLWLAAAVIVVWFAAAVYLGIYWNGRMEFWMQAPANGWEYILSTLLSGVLILMTLCLPAVIAGLIRLIAHAFSRVRSAPGKLD